MTPAQATEQDARKRNGISELLLSWVAPVVLLLFGIAVWSNHFDNSFHGDDFPAIVNNKALESLGNVPQIFSHPQLASADPENADYRPLLTTDFAIDRALTRTLNSGIYQLETFLWFGIAIFGLYVAFRLIPGTTHGMALFAAGLFGLHPVAAETVNYIFQRGYVVAVAGVGVSLALWLAWPRRMPAKLGLNLNRVPQNWWQDQIRTHGLSWERTYKAFLRLPIPFYLISLTPALLFDPATAVFALLLLAYVALYDSALGYKRLIVPSVLCGGYFIFQTALVLHVAPGQRIPALSYWVAQPWAVMMYLGRFFAPNTISADSGFQASSMNWGLGLAGVAGVSVLVACAVLAGRREQWRGVAFGLWWFLIGLVPAALAPKRSVDANPRMLLASAGLAFAVSHLGGIVYRKVAGAEREESVSPKAAVQLGFAFVAMAILILCGWMTYQRNSVWATEKTLWADVIQRNPQSGRGFLMYATALVTEGDYAEANKMLQKAVPLCENDGPLELGLAQAFDQTGKDVDAELHYRRALTLSPSASAYAYFGQWLFTHQRLNEAYEMSKKALSIDPNDLVSRHTLMDLYSTQSNWTEVAKIAKETLGLNPQDTSGKRSLTVATASIDQLEQAKEDAKNSPDVDRYLKLSVLYYQAHQYEECAAAAREALKLRPNMAEAYANLASAMHTMGRDDEAIAALREVIRLRPDMEFAKIDLEILLDKKASDAASPRKQ